MKYFSEVLIAGLALSILTLIYCLFRITMEILQQGLFSEFAIGYAMGFISPILIGLWIATQISTGANHNGNYNTGRSKALNSIGRLF